VVETVVGLLEFDGRKVAVDLEQPVVVEPVDVVQGRGFDLLGGVPGAAGVDQSVLNSPITDSARALVCPEGSWIVLM